MPPYDISLILKLAAKPQLKESIKRTLLCIKEQGGVVGRLENLGEKSLPYRITAQGTKHTKGFYMFIEADMPANATDKLMTQLTQDKDILRPAIIRQEVENPRPCEKGECFFGELSNTELLLVKKWGTFTKRTI